MRRILLAETGIEVSRLSFGTASLHHLFTSKNRQMLLESCLEGGITHFDTSPFYGFGIGEMELGLFLKRHPGKVTVATKFGLYPPASARPSLASVLVRKTVGKFAPAFSKPRRDWSVPKAAESLENSLRRLQVSCIDLLFLHEPSSDMAGSQALLHWLKKEKKKGNIRAWGLAGPAGPVEKWLKAGNGLGQVLQIPDSLENSEADILKKFRRLPQITYGYLSSARQQGSLLSSSEILSKALERNKQGTVLFSTRRFDHLSALLPRQGNDL